MNRNKGFNLVLSVLFVASVFLAPSALAIYGGDLAIGDVRVVSLLSSRDNIRSGCTGSLIEPQIVVSAAHCIGNPGMTYASEVYEPKDLWVSTPGEDLNVGVTSSRVQVLRVLLTKGYNNSWEPEKGNVITQKDDIAFFFLEKPLVTSYAIEIAKKLDVDEIKRKNASITHLGYGLIDQDKADGRPYMTILQSYSVGASRYGNHPALEENTVTSQEIGTKALCGGDSGSPWYATINGVEKLVAVTVGASGCRGVGSGTNGTLGTVIYPYLYLVESHWGTYLAELHKLRASLNSKVPDESKPLIQRSGGCDAKVSAMLQTYVDEKWIDFAEAQGWERVASCPQSNPYQPWVRADLEAGTKIRWRIWSPGQWEVWTDPIVYQQTAPTPSATPIPVVETAPTPTPSPAPVVAKKKNTIACFKGKVKKLITSVNPKCPSGYKKK